MFYAGTCRCARENVQRFHAPERRKCLGSATVRACANTGIFRRVFFFFSRSLYPSLNDPKRRRKVLVAVRKFNAVTDGITRLYRGQEEGGKKRKEIAHGSSDTNERRTRMPSTVPTSVRVFYARKNLPILPIGFKIRFSTDRGTSIFFLTGATIVYTFLLRCTASKYFAC